MPRKPQQQAEKQDIKHTPTQELQAENEALRAENSHLSDHLNRVNSAARSLQDRLNEAIEIDETNTDKFVIDVLSALNKFTLINRTHISAQIFANVHKHIQEINHRNQNNLNVSTKLLSKLTQTATEVAENKVGFEYTKID